MTNRPAAGEARTHLERLGTLLQGRGWQVNLLGGDQHAELSVTNPAAPALYEVVRCRKDPAGWRFAWSWHEAIGPVERVGHVADRIGYVLRAVPGEAPAVPPAAAAAAEPALTGRDLGIAFDWRVVLLADRPGGDGRACVGAVGRAELPDQAHERLVAALAELPPGTAARGEVVRVFVYGDVPDRLVEVADRATDGTITWTVQPVR